MQCFNRSTRSQTTSKCICSLHKRGVDQCGHWSSTTSNIGYANGDTHEANSEDSFHARQRTSCAYCCPAAGASRAAAPATKQPSAGEVVGRVVYSQGCSIRASLYRSRSRRVRIRATTTYTKNAFPLFTIPRTLNMLVFTWAYWAERRRPETAWYSVARE